MIVIFIITALISFLGSVHPGPLNLSVINCSLQQGLKLAIFMILGGILPEIIYSALAITGFDYLKTYPQVFTLARWITVLMLVLMGFFYLFPNKSKAQKQSHFFGFAKGFLLSITNFQLIAFWIFVVIYFDSYNFLSLNSWLKKIAFVLGTAFGAFLLNYVYAYFTHKYRIYIFEKISLKLINWLMVLSFWSMAGLQAYSLLNN